MNALWYAIGTIVLIMFVIMVWVYIKKTRQEVSLEELGLWVKLIRDLGATLLIPPIIAIMKSNKLDGMSVVVLIGLCAFLIVWTDYWDIFSLRKKSKNQTDKNDSSCEKDSSLVKKSDNSLPNDKVANSSEKENEESEKDTKVNDETENIKSNEKDMKVNGETEDLKSNNKNKEN